MSSVAEAEARRLPAQDAQPFVLNTPMLLDEEAVVEEALRAPETGEDAVIEVAMSLDPLSDEVLEVVERAAERLRNEYGVEVIVVPRYEYWGYAGLSIGFTSYPRIRVNGYLIATGQVDEEEVIDAVLALLGSWEEADAAPDAMIQRWRMHLAPAEALALAS